MAADRGSITSQPKWKLQIASGILLALAIWGVYRNLVPPIPPDIVALARESGRDPRTFYDAKTLIARAEQDRDLSPSDWNRVLSIFQSSNVRDREDAMRIMTFLGDSARHDEILNFARANLNSSEPAVVMQALRLEWVCHAPEWRAEAEQRKDRPEEEIKETVQALLARGEYVRKAKKP